MEHTYGSATLAEKSASYVLAKCDYGREAYWTGSFGKNGHNHGKVMSKAKSSLVLDNAIVFKSIDEATEVATADERLHYFHIVPACYKENADGFKSRWWLCI